MSNGPATASDAFAQHYAALANALADEELDHPCHVQVAAPVVGVFASQDVYIDPPHPARPALEAALRRWWAAQGTTTRAAVLAVAAAAHASPPHALSAPALTGWAAVFLD